MTNDLNGLDNRISVRGFFERVLKEREEATRVAETEREKAAQALRDSLTRDMSAGDARLQDHIDHQIEQVKQALQALTLLLTERDGRMDDRFSSHREAIQKAEDALNKRLEAMNEFRDQLKDQTATFAVKESTDGRLAKLEGFQGRLLGAFGLAMIVMPLVIGIAVYMLTRNAIPIAPTP